MDSKWTNLLARPLSLSRGENSLHWVGRASWKQGCAGRRELDQSSQNFCGGEHFHSLSQVVKVSCLSLYIHSVLLPLTYTPFCCQSDLFQTQIWLLAKYTSSTTSTTSTAVILQWLPSTLRRRTELKCIGLGTAGPGCPPQPHPITPSNGTGLSDHQASSCSLLPRGLFMYCSFCLRHSSVPSPSSEFLFILQLSAQGPLPQGSLL